eukprot:scaffold154711_cov31-Tisochrysis_lutea.AAC.1
MCRAKAARESAFRGFAGRLNCRHTVCRCCAEDRRPLAGGRARNWASCRGGFILAMCSVEAARK